MRAADVIEVVISAPAKVTQIDNGKLSGYDTVRVRYGIGR